MTTPKVVGVPGSLSDDSNTVKTVTLALLAAGRAGAETELLDLRTCDLPLFDPDDRGIGDAPRVKRTVREADGVVLGSPVYHGSYSSAFKSFHDYCGFDEYEDTLVGLVVVAGGGTIASALDHMRATVRGVHGWVLPNQVGIRDADDRIEATDEPVGTLSDGTPVEWRITDAGVAERVDELGEELVANLQAPGRVPACVGADD